MPEEVKTTAVPEEVKSLRTEPTKEAPKGGSYDAETGECLEAPPEERVHQREREE